MSRGTPVDRVLDDVKATVIYADPALRADPAFAAFQALSQAAAWRTVASGTGSDGDWSILIRRKRVTT